ncbi:CLUMA_CG019216, isoform A [Clunio marinus]|uniref:CLUMA_CG019216, isoform A n=1 Tax=Clunio marinus TaxID=568069 RepID=A0A1J1J1X8_9DIPT|nr:CLUMA_CG019216, isoform A [Clunio marinus]
MDHNKENTSSDPISFFPSEITAKIFNYLDTKDILAASEVSKSWCNFIADSSHCLRKVKLNFNPEMIVDHLQLSKSSFFRNHDVYSPNLSFSYEVSAFI